MPTHEWRPRMPCPFCGAPNECATNADGRNNAPKPDAVIICFSCGAVTILGTDYRLRAPTAAERDELDRHPGVKLALKAQRELKRRRAN